ncbi:MAG: hypothetical protein H6Q73_3621 [Firmicutes bacterium]|nr:hypothetical protein [Bacillota bacterium]
MNFKQLTYFISVAEHLNFSKAAAEHYIAQTAISQQIATLEKELGTPLFYRNSRIVRLTNGGEVFYKEAKFLVEKSEEAIKKTILANSGSQGNLSIGFQGPNEKIFLPKIIRNFRQKYPKIYIKLFQESSDDLHTLLKENLIDISFLFSYGIEEFPELNWKNVCRDPLCAIVPPDHPLAKKSTLSRSDLANEPIVHFSHKDVPIGYNLLIRDCVTSGFMPNIVAEAPSIETLLIMVEAGLGIAVLPLSLKTYTDNTLSFVELEGENEYNQLIAAWPKDATNPTIPLFLQALDEYFISAK